MERTKRYAIVGIGVICLAFLIFLATLARADAQTAPFRLCTGGDRGNYFAAGNLLKKLAPSVDPILTAGSTDNLDRLVKGECAGAFVQADALQVYAARNARILSTVDRVGVLYSEHVHLLCNRKAGFDRIVDLKSANDAIALGEEGSGVWTTWAGFVLADKKRYGPVQIDDRSEIAAFTAVADGKKVKCTMFVGALGAPLMKNDATMFGDNAVLISSYDRDMAKNAKDERGEPLYGVGEIPAGTYPAIQPKALGWGTKPVDTMTVEAVFVVNSAWAKANRQGYNTILRAFAGAKPAIAALVAPK